MSIGDDLLAGCGALSHSADSYENDPRIEQLWAQTAYEHAEVHFNLLSSVDTKLLRLTPIDEEIYKHFREQFPGLKLDTVDEDHMKSNEQKEIWRNFCEHYKTKLENYNFATLLRLKCDGDYTPENTTIAPKIQFYAIEIARNREGFNDVIRLKKKKKKNVSYFLKVVEKDRLF
ncbi:hypothetical protein PGB90_007142 [Kerria lacca]